MNINDLRRLAGLPFDVPAAAPAPRAFEFIRNLTEGEWYPPFRPKTGPSDNRTHEEKEADRQSAEDRVKKKREKRRSEKPKRAEELDEKSPPGFKGTVKAMKKHKDIDNPFALAWWMKKKGAKSHYAASGKKK